MFIRSLFCNYLSAVFSLVLIQQAFLESFLQSLKTGFQGSHHFGSLWWRSFMTAIASPVFTDFTTAITSAAFADDSFSRQPSLRQSLMTVSQHSHHFGSLWWHSIKTDMTSAVFDDALSIKTAITSAVLDDTFKTAITSAVFDDSAFLKRTFRSRFRE